LIRSGVVSVDGTPVTEMGVTVDPDLHTVCVDGRPVRPQSTVYLAVHKPPGVMCTSRDPQGRRTVLDLLPAVTERVYTVGRLDLDSEGLLLVTNDGTFAHRLMHPRHHVRKVYQVWIRGALGDDQRAACLAGVTSDRDVLRALEVAYEGFEGDARRYRVVLGEGKKRHIRRMFFELGHRVVRLRRVRIGPLGLGTLAPGQVRPLTPEEVRALLEASA
jgi:pseudouridine synthase